MDEKLEERSEATRISPASTGAVMAGAIAGASAMEYYWLAWFLLGFGIPEAYALYRTVRYGDKTLTLSVHIRKWFATDVVGRTDLTLFGKLRRVVLMFGLSWLAVHLLTNGMYF